MPQTSLKQKFSLFIFSVFLTLLILEGILRLCGAAFNAVLERGNRSAFDEGEVRILCLGESTTALGSENSYPSQLAQILQRRRPDLRFSVINKGLVNKTSRTILENLDGYLKRYRPDIVVTMIGINDDRLPPAEGMWGMGVQSASRHLKVVQFFRMLAAHVRHKMAEKGEDPLARKGRDAWKDDKDLEDRYYDEWFSGGTPTKALQQLEEVRQGLDRLQTYMRYAPSKAKKVLADARYHQLIQYYIQMLVSIGHYYREHKDYPRAEQYLGTAQSMAPGSYGLYLELGRLARDQNRLREAVSALKEAVEIEPDLFLAHLELARCYVDLHQKEKARRHYMAVFHNPQALLSYFPEIGEWLFKNGYPEDARIVYETAIEKNQRDVALYIQLAGVYEVLGEQDLAQKMKALAADQQQRIEYYLPVTVRNYNAIAEKILAGGSRLICMQYPLRKAGPLRKIFWKTDGMIFLENDANFREALEHKEYGELFSDLFAGDFGHCTREGNRLIAQNLAEAVLKMTDDR